MLGKQNNSYQNFHRKRRSFSTKYSSKLCNTQNILLIVCIVVSLIFYAEFSFLVSSLTFETDSTSYLDPDSIDSIFSEGYSDQDYYVSTSWQFTPTAPKLKILLQKLDEALIPLQEKYLNSIGHYSKDVIPQWNDPLPNKYLGGCPRNGCLTFSTLEEAKEECEKEKISCGGIVASGFTFELRSRKGSVHDSPADEKLYLLDLGQHAEVKNLRRAKVTAKEVWDAFTSVLESSLGNPDLHLLDPPLQKTREDGSIYVSIASYRDDSCPFTVANAFLKAKDPEKVFIGLVQQNCANDACYTGTGWGDTRKWVPSKNDVDCIDALPSEVRKYMKNIRVLKLEERQSYGPFFSRYLNSKIYAGENYYMQIDAHTEFKPGWDEELRSQIRSTKSYPYSILSNYPPSGIAKTSREWDAFPKATTPSGLCSAKFEGAGKRLKTVRLGSTYRRFARGVDRSIPHKTCFVAAGFFFAHGSIVQNVPFDPFMPYLFMGEEIALSVRFWTNGYDIYGPGADVLRHEYIRKESPKFWESVTMIFDSGSIHNDLTDLIIPRVQMLLGYEEGKKYPERKEEIEPISLTTYLDKFYLGDKRSVDDFVKFTGIDLEKLEQTVPEWCSKGTD
eukprot:maker-scaffold_10-snap-gene-10.41-mRNA-1 protein AED:0.20 eAED:0.20 QI:30/1/1/1/1/1/4/173/615